jgi:hypothetical protein
MVKIYESIGRPQNTSQLPACDNLAGIFEQMDQDEEGLFAELDRCAAAAIRQLQ